MKDLLGAIEKNRWRLDCNAHLKPAKPGWRILYYCTPCKIWRCVEESGVYHGSPDVAIRAAIVAKEAEGKA